MQHCVTTTRGLELPYDVLVLACGALPTPAVRGALAFRGPADAERFRRLLDEVEREPTSGIAFVQPSGTTWPLPLYELALKTATRPASRRTTTASSRRTRTADSPG